MTDQQRPDGVAVDALAGLLRVDNNLVGYLPRLDTAASR